MASRDALIQGSGTGPGRFAWGVGARPAALPGSDAWYDAWLDAGDAAQRGVGGASDGPARRMLLAAGTPVLVVAVTAAPYSMPRPFAPSVSITSSLFPEVVPGFDQEVGLQLPSRPTDPQATSGLRAGSFRVQPAIEEGLGYDSNVQGIRGGRGSTLLRTAPEVSVQSDWSRNRLGAYLGLENSTYLDVPRQSRTDVAAALGGGYTVGRGEATVAYSLLSLHDDPGALGGIPASQPIPFTVNDLRASYRASFGRVTATPFVDYSLWRYGNAQVADATISQTYRDRDVLQAGAAARFELAERRSLVLTASAIDSRFGRQPTGAAAPDSTSGLVLGGTEYEISGPLRLRALAGVETRAFRSSAYRGRTVPVGLVSLTWRPTGLTTVTGTVARSLEDLAQEDVGGTAYTRGEVVVEHELRRNIVARAVAGVQSAEFLQRGGTQTTAYGGLGVGWALGRNLRLQADYLCRWQSALPDATNAQAVPVAFGRVGTGGYVRNIAQLSLRATL